MQWKPQVYRLEKEFSLPREKVWELVSHTDHLNRMIGLFAIQAGVSAADSHLRRIEARKLGGLLTLSWNERPFEWRQKEFYSVVREYTGGPMRRFHGGVELADARTVLPDGQKATVVRLFGEFTPANAAGVLAIPLFGKKAMKLTLKYLTSYFRLAAAGRPDLLPQPKRAYSVNEKVLLPLLDMLRQTPIPARMIERFYDHLRLRGDEEVIEMRPFEWHEAWGGTREEALRLLLYTTQIGVTNLSWHLICPNCRISKEHVGALAQLKTKYHCDFCGIFYEASFDQFVELRFSVHPAVRQAYKQTYCIGGPAIFPHIKAQFSLAAGEAARVVIPPEAEKLRLRVLKANHSIQFRHGESYGEENRYQELAYTDKGWLAEALKIDGRKGGEVGIRNRSAKDIVLALEQIDWSREVATAAKVSCMPEFRGMFSSEVLAPGTQVGIRSIAFLFSDLAGSTAFYERNGDASAYGLVRKHFDFMRSRIERSGGTIVKTIGDAVMAVFESPRQALQAAVDIQTDVGEFNDSLSPVDPVMIKIGVHAGPAIAVNANDILDYFGQTVNIAARLEHLSREGDIVTSEQCALLAGEGRLPDETWEGAELFTGSVKGIGTTLRLVRIRPARSP